MRSNHLIQDSKLQESNTFSDYKIFRNRELVFRQGELSEAFYLVKRGAVKLQKMLPNGSQSIIRIVIEGEIFGEGLHEQHSLNSSSAYVIEDDTWIQKIEIEKFSSADYSQWITYQLLEWNRQMGIRHERFLIIEAEERIKQSLYDLAIKKGKKYGDETLLKINLTHEEIAFLADTSRQMVSKTLSELKKSGLINYSRNRFLFRNIQQFKHLLN